MSNGHRVDRRRGWAFLIALLIATPGGAGGGDPQAGAPSMTARPRGLSGLGLYSRDLSRRERAALPLDETAGVLVTGVVANGPAEQAGIRAGQRIVQVDGQRLHNDAAFSAALAGRTVGSEVRLALRDSSGELMLSLRTVERLSYLAPACEAGDGRACWDLLMLYGWRAAPPSGANGPEPSRQRACDLGSPQACTQVGWRLVTKVGAAGDRARGLHLLEQACASGDAEACRVLAEAYLRGSWRLVASQRRALQFFEKACDAGNTEGCDRAARLLDSGEATQRDPVRARGAYEEACLRESATACHQLALFWRDGRGGLKDTGRALMLLQHACESDVPDACVDLGELLSVASEADGRRGLQLQREACGPARPEECSARGYSIGSSHAVFDVERGERMCDPLRHPAVSRHHRVCASFAFAREPGSGETLRGDEALTSAAEECERGNLLGCWRAGELLADGDEVPADLPRARQLLARACAGKVAPSCAVLERIGTAASDCH
jgi:TPR repeat protein